MDRLPAAAALLRALVTVASSSYERESAASMLLRVEELEKWKAATAAAAAKGLPAPPAPSPPSSLSGPGTSDSQPMFIPSWRVVGPGEERVEGVLERIECDAKIRASLGIGDCSSSRVAGT
jgi:hypothetical protein